MAVLNTALVFTVYCMNFILLMTALFLIYICLSDQRQKFVAENVNIEFEFLVLFPKLLLAIAVVVAIVSFIGCLGIAIDNTYVLLSYIALVGIMMVLEFVFVVYLTQTLSPTNEEAIKKKILELIKSNSANQPNTMHGIQQKYKCCGIDDYHDWIKITKKVPGSCCPKGFHDDESCPVDIARNKPGCKKVIMDKISSALSAVYGIIIGVFAVQIILEVCCILILMDFGKSDKENVLEGIFYVGQQEKTSVRHDEDDSNHENSTKIEESIDTHSLHFDPTQVPSPVVGNMIELHDTKESQPIQVHCKDGKGENKTHQLHEIHEPKKNQEESDKIRKYEKNKGENQVKEVRQENTSEGEEIRLENENSDKGISDKKQRIDIFHS